MTEMPEIDTDQPAAAREAPRIFSTEELMGGQSEILIRHGDQVYRLRVTRNDKLILQK